jgi:hypothetical protein
MRRTTQTAALAIAAAVAAAGGGGACSTDILDVDVALRSDAFHFDFGTASGTVPAVACDARAANACGDATALGVATAGADVQAQTGCDPATGRCFAEAHGRVALEVAVAEDDDFSSKVERGSVTVVRMVDVSYEIPTNTLTFEVPIIDVFVGPAGAQTEADPGVVLVDTLPAVPAGQTFGDGSHHLIVADGSPARALLEQSIQGQQPFVFVVTLAPRFEAGSPVPAGAIEIDLHPRLRLGLPR